MNKQENMPGQFNPMDWLGGTGPLQPDNGRWWVEAINGPRDACLLVRIREFLSGIMPLGPPSPTDIFLLATGRGDLRRGCGIGGMPYMRRGRPWPESQSGRPLPFVAQFDFADSRDIVGDLPGELLLLFGRPGSSESLVIRWETALPRDQLVQIDDIPIQPEISQFRGVRWRTSSYPQCDDREYDGGNATLADGTEITDIPNALTPLGFQIGAHPFMPLWQLSLGKDERVLCSMCTVYPIPDVPYPFVDHPDPISLAESRAYAVNFSEIDLRSDGFAVIYVIADDSGGFRLAKAEL
jgi:hypothetical protein